MPALWPRNSVSDFCRHKTDSTSPGIALVQPPANRTGTGFGDPAFADTWEQHQFVHERARGLHLISPEICQRSGCGFDIRVAKPEARSLEPAEDPEIVFSAIGEQIAAIKSSLSLQVKELAEILGVERPTIYSWINRCNTPRPASREKLHVLHRLAQQWNRLATAPLGSALHEADEDGATVFHLLRNPLLPESLLRKRLNALAQTRKSIEQEASSTRPKATLRDLAKKHGIDIERVADQQEELDLETGKRISPE